MAKSSGFLLGSSVLVLLFSLIVLFSAASPQHVRGEDAEVCTNINLQELEAGAITNGWVMTEYRGEKREKIMKQLAEDNPPPFDVASIDVIVVLRDSLDDPRSTIVFLDATSCYVAHATWPTLFWRQLLDKALGQNT